MRLYQCPKTAVYTVGFLPDGSGVIAGTKDGHVRCWFDDLETVHQGTAQMAGANINAVACTPNDAVYFGFDQQFWCWHPRESLTDAVMVNNLDAEVTAVSVYDENTLLVGTGGRLRPTRGRVFLYDLRTHRPRLPEQVCVNGARAVAVHPATRTVGWTSHLAVALWTITKPDIRQFTLSKPAGPLAFRPDGLQLAVAADWDVATFDVATLRPQTHLRSAHTGRVTAVAYSPDGRTLATAGWDKLVKLWDADTGRLLVTCDWGLGQIHCLTYAPDGLRLAAGDGTGTVAVWDTE